MKSFIFAFILSLFGIGQQSLATTPSVAGQPPGTSQENLYQFKTADLDGKSVQLSSFKGKVLMIVNTASECGYTPQYNDLEAIYKKYQQKGFVVLGFPSNDFGGQEPGTNAEIKKFCDLKNGRYKISFPMFAKSNVKSNPQNPIFEYLTKKSPTEFQGDIQWNFTKFLINKSGQVIARFPSKTNPSDVAVTSVIEKAL